MISLYIKKYSTVLFYIYIFVLIISVSGWYLSEPLRDKCFFSITPIKFFISFGIVFVLSAFGPAQNLKNKGLKLYVVVMIAHVFAILVVAFFLMAGWDEYLSQGFC